MGATAPAQSDVNTAEESLTESFIDNIDNLGVDDHSTPTRTQRNPPTPTKYRLAASPEPISPIKRYHRKITDPQNLKKILYYPIDPKHPDGKEMTFNCGPYGVKVEQFLNMEVAEVYKCQMCLAVSYIPVIADCGHLYCSGKPSN